MGYTTNFWGQIVVKPALSEKEIAYLNNFSGTRRMREKGEYYCGTGYAGQDKELDIIDFNFPPPEQPNLWCSWVPTENGDAIEWDEHEKFYSAAEWMWYLIQNFLKPDPIAKIRFPKQFAFLKGHICNGTIEAQGEDSEDRWRLIVKDNEVSVTRAHWTFNRPELVENEALTIRYCYETNKQSKKCDDCDKRFKCYTGSPEPTPKYGSWGENSFWGA